MRKTNPFICPHCKSVFDELPVQDGYAEENRDFAWFECPICRKLWLEEIYIFGIVLTTNYSESESEEEENGLIQNLLHSRN